MLTVDVQVQMVYLISKPNLCFLNWNVLSKLSEQRLKLLVYV